jgi:hypothetical protein
MKLDISEVYFLAEVTKQANIKLEKEFERLQKLQQKEDSKLQKA